MPDIKALDLGRVDTVVIDDEPWQVICVQVQGAAEHLWSQGADATDDCDTVFDVYCLDEDLNVVTQAIDAETIRSLKWSVADGAYRDADGRLFRFFESTPVR